MIDPQALARAAMLYGCRVFVPKVPIEKRPKHYEFGRITFVLVKGTMGEPGTKGKFVYEHNTLDQALAYIKGLANGDYGWASFDSFDIDSVEIEP